jgi:hypothetical protein
MKPLVEKKGIAQLKPYTAVQQGRGWDVLSSIIHRDNTIF